METWSCMGEDSLFVLGAAKLLIDLTIPRHAIPIESRMYLTAYIG